MNVEMFREIEREFSTQHAIAAFQMRSIAASMKFNKYNLFDGESACKYKADRDKKIKRAFKGYSSQFVQECLNIYNAMYEWEIANNFDGLGGCTKKTFTELVEKTSAKD